MEPARGTELEQSVRDVTPQLLLTGTAHVKNLGRYNKSMFGSTLELGSHMPVVHVPRNIQQNNYQQCASDVLCWFSSVPMWVGGALVLTVSISHHHFTNRFGLKDQMFSHLNIETFMIRRV